MPSASATALPGESHIRFNYTKALRVEELAGLAAMSVSSFHRHFRGVTPTLRSLGRVAQVVPRLRPNQKNRFR
jgi:AraC-like DNA-binding protein